MIAAFGVAAGAPLSLGSAYLDGELRYAVEIPNALSLLAKWWLILVITLFWTTFPPAFAAFASTLYIPLTLAALGMIGRGAAFAFRKASHTLAEQRLYGGTFALSSVATPFFLGTIVGALASGRVPPGIAKGDILRSWLNPTSIYSGLLAVGVCAYLAAVFLLHDARRAGAADLVAQFRRRALATGVVVGAGALAGLAVVAADPPALFADLRGRTAPGAAVPGRRPRVPGADRRRPVPGSSGHRRPRRRRRTLGVGSGTIAGPPSSRSDGFAGRRRPHRPRDRARGPGDRSAAARAVTAVAVRHL